jgi:hypothetical protein
MLALTLLAAMAFSPAGSIIRKGPVPLADHVDKASVICIGRVDDVIRVALPGIHWPSTRDDSLPIARIVVERVLKGPQDLKLVYHSVWPTWACDTTRAEVGQRALFLLSPDAHLGDAPQQVRDAISLALGTDDVLRNVGSGDGILPIRVFNGEELVHYFETPKALRMRDYDSRLTDIVNYIEVLARFAPELVTVYARSESLGEDVDRSRWFDARILADGSCRLAVALGQQERVSMLQLDEAKWRALRSDLDVFVGAGDRLLGDPSYWSPERRLVVRTTEGTLRFLEPRKDDRRELQGAERLTLQDALGAWTAIADMLACSDCYDHSDADREWLQGR